MTDLTTTGVWFFTETMPAGQAAEFAARIESLGYSTLWLPEPHPPAVNRVPLYSGICARHDADDYGTRTEGPPGRPGR